MSMAPHHRVIGTTKKNSLNFGPKVWAVPKSFLMVFLLEKRVPKLIAPWHEKKYDNENSKRIQSCSHFVLNSLSDSPASEMEVPIEYFLLWASLKLH